MIALLRGAVAGRTGNSVIIDVGGVGYLVQASSRTLANVGDLGSAVRLLTCMIVREDSMTLYGFEDEDERDTFSLLLTVQNVGARIALAVLSVLSPYEVLAAIVGADTRAISTANGVGQKLAVRIVTELHDKASAMSLSAGPALVFTAPLTQDPAAEDAKSALKSLGFSRVEIDLFLNDVMSRPDAPRDTASILSACLRLSGAKSS